MGACSVLEIVKSAPAEDAALESVLGEIEVSLVTLDGKIAGSTLPAAQPNKAEGNRRGRPDTGATGNRS